MLKYRILNKPISGRNHFVIFLKISIGLLLLIRNFALKYILFLLSYLVPKSSNTLFFSSVGAYRFPLWRNDETYQFKESPKYLAIYSAKKLKNYLTVFHTPNKKMFGKIEKLGIKPTKGLRAFWHMLRAKYLFVDNNNFFNPNASFLVGNFKIIQCWHGTPLKYMGKRKTQNIVKNLIEIFMQSERNKFQCFVSPCSLTSKVFANFFRNTEILETGYPRNDILFDRSFFETENISQNFGLEKFNKLLLYAPTFRKLEDCVTPFDNNFLRKIDEILRQKKYLLLIKEHPYAKAIEFKQNYSNIMDVSTKVDDIQELLINIDVLISDYSSTIFDFALTEKLQMFYPFDLEEYRRNRGEFYFEYSEENLPGLIIADENDFIQKIEQLEALLEDKNIKSRIKEFKKKYNRYIDGNSCKRLFEHLKLAEENI